MMKKNEIEHELLEIREELLSCMKDDNINKIITKLTEVYVIHEYDGRRVDGKKLKNEMPEIFAQYSKPYKMSEHLQVTINKYNKLND